MKLAVLAVAVLATGCASTGTPAPTSTSTRPATISTAVAATNPPAVVLLPDPARTPGATNPAVTPATIHTTICVPGWTATVRPPAAYTTGLKRRQLAAGYTYRGDTSLRDYEEDHLIPLELGGAPSSPLNLWPQPYAGTGARVKDKIENRLHTLVCAGHVGLVVAQRAIAVDWWAAYHAYP